MGDAAEVLVVSADPDLVLRSRAALEFEGYRVDVACDAEDTLRHLRTGSPSASLLDGSLTCGPQVLEAIETAGRRVRVLVLEATRQSGPDRGWPPGVAGILTPPWSPLTLSQALQDLLATDDADELWRLRLGPERLRPLQES